jgi:hypothetical protein
MKRRFFARIMHISLQTHHDIASHEQQRVIITAIVIKVANSDSERYLHTGACPSVTTALTTRHTWGVTQLMCRGVMVMMLMTMVAETG